MPDPQEIERIAARRREWEAQELAEFLARQPEAHAQDCTASGV